MSSNPETKRPRGRPHGTKLHGVIRYLSEAELKRLIVAAHKVGKKSDLLVSTIYYFGLRVSEAASLRLDDFRPSEKGLMVNIRALKEGKPTEYPVPEQIERKLHRWLEEREALLDAAENPFVFPHRFLTRTGHATPDSIKLSFHTLLRRAKIEGRHSIHDLRHSCAQQKALHGEPVVKIASWLRHRSVASSLHYLHGVEVLDQAKDAERRFTELLQ